MAMSEKSPISHRLLSVPLVMTLIGLVVLLALGKWQLDRREWKLGILSRIDARVHDEPISLTTAKQHWAKDRDIDYYRVVLVGRFLHDYERHLYTVLDGQAGWQILTPLQTGNGEIVLVDRGFVPEWLKEPKDRKRGQIEETVELVGLARGSETPGWFTPDNAPAANRWFWRDIPAMIATLPPDLAAKAQPFVVEAEAAPVPGNWPRGGVTRLEIPNRHLEYALTWFGLAATLLVVFIIYTRKRRIAPGPDAGHAEIAERESSV
ncbi:MULTISPECIES: SURF1 family protein [Rhodomicrobium]|uniref:SURF1 family protein n=1 Tax=Rhodomicrobium TaxID=1068 RepID=UPI000B4A866D|nr:MULTISPECIES: SURF1 family protein [Rhodomicrobium]